MTQILAQLRFTGPTTLSGGPELAHTSNLYPPCFQKGPFLFFKFEGLKVPLWWRRGSLGIFKIMGVKFKNLKIEQK